MTFCLVSSVHDWLTLGFLLHIRTILLVKLFSLFPGNGEDDLLQEVEILNRLANERPFIIGVQFCTISGHAG